ncbi:MAG: hypothetical protein ACE5FC_09275, partial [Myxococcota bacterium]
MKNGWTGGQYSLLRGGLAVYLLFQMFPGLCQDLILPPPWDTPGPGILLVILGSVFCAALLAGWFDRPAAALLALLWFSVELPVLFYTRASSPLIGLLLLWHALLPAAPYLSLAARGRPDPGGGWRVPPRLFSLLWIGLSLFHMSRG